jgi:hypothetical protein
MLGYFCYFYEYKILLHSLFIDIKTTKLVQIYNNFCVLINGNKRRIEGVVFLDGRVFFWRMFGMSYRVYLVPNESIFMILVSSRFPN